MNKWYAIGGLVLGLVGVWYLSKPKWRLDPNNGSTNQTEPFGVVLWDKELQTASSVSFSGVGVTASKIYFKDKDKGLWIAFDVTVSSTAAAGKRDLTVTFSDGPDRVYNGAFTVFRPPV